MKLHRAKTLYPSVTKRSSVHDAQVAMSILELSGDQELPDARITRADRQFVRLLLALAESHLCDEALMHLSGGAEYVALRKRAAATAGRQA
jgi:hypothetical protein